MSESDDTDVLLLIPPDFFNVPFSSDSESDSHYTAKTKRCSGKTGVISELVEHIQLLESRISAIESNDNSLDTSLFNNSFDLSLQFDNTRKGSKILPHTGLSVSQTSSLQNTPIKPHNSLSVPSTPTIYSPSSHTNPSWNGARNKSHLYTDGGTTNTASHSQAKHYSLTTYSDVSVNPSMPINQGILHDALTCAKTEVCSLPLLDSSTNKDYMNFHINKHKTCGTNLSHVSLGSHSQHKTIQEMELSEVDELLQGIEATDLELSKRLSNTGMGQEYREQTNFSVPNQSKSVMNSQIEQNMPSNRTQQSNLSVHQMESHSDVRASECERKSSNVYTNVPSLYNGESHIDETSKMIAEFKMWEQNNPQHINNQYNIATTARNDYVVTHENSAARTDLQLPMAKGFITKENVHKINEINCRSLEGPQIHTSHKNVLTVPASTVLNNTGSTVFLKPKEYRTELSETHSLPQYTSNIHEADISKCHVAPVQSSSQILGHKDSLSRRKHQQFLSLSDFWESNTHKSEEEMLKIKLEEEKFRREHCEHLIQELQKKLLEQQEKVAVAIRVDNEKNVLLSQFHIAWANLKDRVQVLEAEHTALQSTIQKLTEKHQEEINEYQAQVKRCEAELSKALDLAAGYKEKGDHSIKERVELLKAHADELESYKSLVQEAEKRYDQMKGEYNKLLEKNQQTEESLKNIQQELNRERLRGGEVRGEMSVIHKALDACEAELTVLRQEKESLQLKLKEELNRNTILEEKKSSLVYSIDDAKKAEQKAKEEAKSLAEQQAKMRAEMQEVYQKQVDEVVKVKLQEFQTQLDVAESEFLTELDTRQRVIAECSARKIKEVIDKHQLEINLLEDKHKEEKRLYELQLAQAMQKMSILETHLNSQRADKSQLAEQLHSFMQNQWQQALQIISGGNLDNLSPIQRITAEKMFEYKRPRKSESMPNCYTKLSQEPMKLSSQTPDYNRLKNTHLREEQDESFVTLTSADETPLTSKKESKDDLRKYIKMIADMQNSKECLSKQREKVPSPPPICREVPRKHYLKKELSIMSEDSITWQPVTEQPAHDDSEYIPISQHLTTKIDRPKSNRKIPWK